MLFTPYLTRAGRRRARPAAISIRGALRLLPPADGLEARLQADMERLLQAQAEQQGEQAEPGGGPATQDEPLQAAVAPPGAAASNEAIRRGRPADRAAQAEDGGRRRAQEPANPQAGGHVSIFGGHRRSSPRQPTTKASPRPRTPRQPPWRPKETRASPRSNQPGTTPIRARKSNTSSGLEPHAADEAASRHPGEAAAAATTTSHPARVRARRGGARRRRVRATADHDQGLEPDGHGPDNGRAPARLPQQA